MLLAPFHQPGPFLRGSIHCHTNHSDGSLSPQELLAAYRQNGYDFVCITDHFRPEFHFPITDARQYCDDRFFVIPGAELHAPATEQGYLWHITAVGLPWDFAATSEQETGPQLARRAAAAGAFVTLPHPGWYQLTLADAATIPEAHAMEVFNVGCELMHSRGDGSYLIDGLLNQGRHILITAVDDSHMHLPDIALGWVMVRCSQRSPAAVVEALKQGMYYSSNGANLYSLSLEGNTLHVECSAAREILVNGQGYSNAFVYGESITKADIDLAGLKDSPWFRVIVMGMDGSRAWSNPYWRKDCF